MIGAIIKMFTFLRILSLLAYVCIFLPGEKIALPLGFILLFGLSMPEPLNITFLFIVLADLALLSLFTLMLIKKTRKTILVEMLAYVFLLLPLIADIPSIPIRLLNHPLFIVPAVGFIVLYPLSAYLSYSDYNRKQAGLAAPNISLLQ
jgi:hypothetical protein